MSQKSSDGGAGCGALGMAVAAVCSWSVNHSVGWAIIHGLLSWVYVFYYLVSY